VMTDGREQIGDVVIVQRVEGVATRAPCPHEPQAAQDPQIVRRRAGAEVDGGGELLDRTLAVEQRREHAQSAGRGQGLEDLGDVVGLGGAEWTRSRCMLGGMRHYHAV
jgi:hypothetical protein